MSAVDKEIKDLLLYEIKECKELDLNEKSPKWIDSITGLYIAFKEYRDKLEH